ncbi:ComF family protein [Patescibacteria group bacterium]
MILNFLFPRRCLGCGRWGQYFCQGCWRGAQLVGTQICPTCRKGVVLGKTHLFCLKNHSLNGLISLFSYRGIVREAVKKLKYKHLTDLAEELIEKSIGPAKSMAPHFQEILLTPIPLHPRKERKRGFNQAEVLGKLLAQKMGWQFLPDLLKRTRYTQSQTKLKGKQRLENVRGAFEVNDDYQNLSLKSCIFLFDDVWTTGSTLREGGRALKKAGVKEVWGLTLCR